jgi:hypothetical protein
MSTSRLSSADVRTLRTGVVTILAMLFLFRGAPAVHRWTTERHAVAVARLDEVNRAERSIRDHGRTASAHARTRTRLTAYEKALLVATRTPAASAELAELVSEAAEMSEAGLVSIQLRVDSSGGGARLQRVTARATLTGDLESLVLFLHLLEDGPALIAVRELDLAGGDTRVGAGATERLRLEVAAQGLFARTPTQGRP